MALSLLVATGHIYGPMIALLLNLVMLVQTLWEGLRKDAESRALAVLLGVLLAGGTEFYSQVEDWSVLDALYFCVMAIATVGYGDLAPTSSLSKGFTIGFAILGIGVFASFVAELVALRLDLHAKATAKWKRGDARDGH